MLRLCKFKRNIDTIMSIVKKKNRLIDRINEPAKIFTFQVFFFLKNDDIHTHWQVFFFFFLDHPLRRMINKRC